MMNAKILQMIAAVALTAAATACNNNEFTPYEGGSEPGSPVDVSDVRANATYKTPSGNSVVVSAIGDEEFAYNRFGLPLEAADIEIDYAEGSLAYDCDGDVSGTALFGIDSRGFITAIDYTEASDDRTAPVQTSAKGSAKLTYSPKGYLTKWVETASISEKDYDSGLDRLVKKTVTRILKWEEGTLVAVDETEETSEGKLPVAVRHTYYDVVATEENPLRQYTLGFATMIVPERFAGLALTGLTGNASASLPRRAVTETSVKVEDAYTVMPKATAHTWVYEFNSNTTLSKEIIDGNGHAYSYIFID